MSAVSPADHTPQVAFEAGRIAELLRWLGALAVALSAVVFLLQGMDAIDLAIRHWAYLVLMAALTGCGVITRALFADARSARLLLGLAVALVPIQLAQVAGMHHGLLVGGDNILTSVFAFDLVSVGTIAAVTLVTLVGLVPVLYTGFAVLMRPMAGRLAAAFAALGLLLLLPWRADIGGVLVLMALVVATLIIDRRLLAATPRTKTPEGRAVRALFLLPLAIAATRISFHIDALEGWCMLAGMAGLAAMYLAQQYVARCTARELLYGSGALAASLAWGLWSVNAVVPSSGALALTAVFLPIALFVHAAGVFTALGRRYRTMAAMLVSLAALGPILAATVLGSAVALGMGVVFTLIGAVRREREPTLTGAAIAVVAFAALSVQALAHVTVSSWLSLAIAGVALVLCASIIERHGRDIAVTVRDRLREVAAWQ